MYLLMFEDVSAWIVLYVMFLAYLVINLFVIYQVRYGKGGANVREAFANFQLFITLVFLSTLIMLYYLYY